MAVHRRSRSHRNRILPRGRTFFVDATNGNDSNDGRFGGTAWQTISKVNGSSFDPGDRILFKRGESWGGATRLIAPSSGEITKPIVFGNYGSGALPIISTTLVTTAMLLEDVDYITVDGLDIDGATVADFALLINRCIGVRVADCTIRRSNTYDGLMVQGTSANCQNIIVERCTAHSNGHYGGIGVAGVPDPGTDGPANVVIRHNTCYSNGSSTAADHGIYLRSGGGSQVHGNISYNNASSGIKLRDYVDSVIDGNLVYGNYYGLQMDEGTNGISGNTWQNNVAYDNTMYSLIVVVTGSHAEYVYHNTLVNGNSHGIYFTGTVSDMVFRNNIVLQDQTLWPSSACYRAGASVITGCTFSNNCLSVPDSGTGDCVLQNGTWYTLSEWQGVGEDAGSIDDNPSFVTDYTNFHLQSGSACRGAGATGLFVIHDYNGIARGDPPDIGAYEYI